MVRLNLCLVFAILPGVLYFSTRLEAQAQSSVGATPNKAQARLCPPAVLSRLVRHRVQSGETLASIAQNYGLSTTTLKGMNPRLRQGSAPIGIDLVVPPYNGILVAVPAGQTLKDVARAYRVSMDVLFELNGCQLSPKVVFVPGVIWSGSLNPQPTGIAPLQSLPKTTRSLRSATSRDRYPLPQRAPMIGTYGWRVNPETGKMQFFSGVDLRSLPGTPVYAVSSGTVVFAGEQGSSGKFVIILHNQGRQTRYGRLGQLKVHKGQNVQPGDSIGTVGSSSPVQVAHLRFEVRYRSSLGWVAHDPQPYLQSLEQKPK
jgi:murein DD-endopeptidase MepM/ murein hydrolase activator NlpD